MRRCTPPIGVSLLELIVSIGIAVLIGGVVLTLNLDQLRFSRLAQERSEIENSTRLALNRMVKAIRDAQPSATGAFPLITAGTQGLTFYANTDVDAGIELVRFFLNGTLIQRGIIQPVGSPATYPAGNEVITTVTTNIRNGAAPVFEYFDENYLGTGAPLSQPVTVSDIRLVRVTLIVDANTAATPPASTLTTYIQLRNLKDNF